MSRKGKEGKEIISAQGEGCGPHPGTGSSTPCSDSSRPRRVCAVSHSLPRVGILTPALWSLGCCSVTARPLGPPEDWTPGRCCTLTTSSSADLHPTDSDTSTTEPSSWTPTTLMGTETAFPVRTAVFRISVSYTREKRTCQQAGLPRERWHGGVSKRPPTSVLILQWKTLSVPQAPLTYSTAHQLFSIVAQSWLKLHGVGDCLFSKLFNMLNTAFILVPN